MEKDYYILKFKKNCNSKRSVQSLQNSEIRSAAYKARKILDIVIVYRKMNVLSKIVIPKTNVTAMYINSELEEFEREEFFRLKKILEIKKKMFGEVKEKKEPKNKTEELIISTSTTSDPVRERSISERCLFCKALLLPVSSSLIARRTEESEKTTEFKSRLSEIVNITKDIDKQGLIAASIEDFIKTAKTLKEKLEQKSSGKGLSETDYESSNKVLNKLCNECKNKYLQEKAAKAKRKEPEPENVKLVVPESEFTSLVPPNVSRETIKEVIQPFVSEPPDLELSTIKAETEEESEPEKIKVLKLDSGSSLVPLQESKETIKEVKQSFIFESIGVELDTFETEIQGEPVYKIIDVIKPDSLTSLHEQKPSLKEDKQSLASESVGIELGTFKIEIKKITKVVRIKQEDGSIVQVKKVIRVKKEVRTPMRVENISPPSPINQDRAGRITYQSTSESGTSSKTNPYSGSRTVQVITTNSLDCLQRFPKCYIIPKKARSEMISPPPPMSDPVARYCMSSMTLLSMDFGDSSSSFVESYTDYE